METPAQASAKPTVKQIGFRFERRFHLTWTVGCFGFGTTVMTSLGWAKRLLKNERGNVLVMGSAMMPLMIGAAAVGLDTIQLSLWKRQLQRAADSGAIAGARALVQSKDAKLAVSRALAFDGQTSLLTPAIVQHAPEDGAYKGDAKAVRVILSAQRTLPFWSFFMKDSPPVTVEATAKVVANGSFCLLSLEEANSTGIDFAGNANVNLSCGLATNATGATAVTASGESQIVATPVTAMGGITQTPNFKSPTVFNPFAEKQQDPLAYLPNPTLPAGACPTAVVEPSASAHFLPGCYKGMTFKGSATLAPGTYYIDGGLFEATSKAMVNAPGVTIVLTSSTAATDPASVAKLKIDAGAQLNLTAPSSGTYGGLLIYQDRRAAPLNSAYMAGGSSGKLEGAIYLPAASVTVAGSSQTNTDCLQLIGRRLYFTGGISIANSCSAGGAAKAFSGTYVRLVA